LSSAEGRLLLAGVGIASAYTLWLVVMTVVRPEQSQELIGMTATAVLFGRAAGMAFGYSVGCDHETVIVVCSLVETVLVLIMYPLFVLGWRHLLVIKGLRKVFERIRRAAEARKDTIRRYGPIGLFAFVWFPFWMTGPVVGSVIGFMLGMRVRVNITIVLVGTYVAIFCWSLLLRHVREQAASYSSYAATTIMAALIVIIVAANVLYRTLNEKKRKH
jgi:uncharacterized membrane protein